MSQLTVLCFLNMRVACVAVVGVWKVEGERCGVVAGDVLAAADVRHPLCCQSPVSCGAR